MFINQNLGYKSLLRKHSLKTILKMYMKGDVALNNKEWKDLHLRLERRRIFKEKISILNAGVCLIIIILLAYITEYNNFDKIERCSKIEEHYCTKYDLERIIDK